MNHPYGWWSILPPVVAIGLAIVTRRAALSLLVGVFAGALLTAGGDLPRTVHDLCEVHLWPALADAGKLRVYSFTLLMGGLIGVLSESGAMRSFVARLVPLARSRRGAQLTTWLLGLAVFFDDYANTLLLGGTLRPLCDRFRVSREKLAYLVDSTAAPVAGISILSTWVAVELDYLQEGIAAISTETGLSPFDLFVATIPYRFYVLGALVLLPVIALSGRDFGPMLAAERRALGTTRTTTSSNADAPGSQRDAHWLTAVLPILTTLGVVLWLLIVTGRQELQVTGAATPPWTLWRILGAARSSQSLQYGALVGLVLAGLLCLLQRRLTWDEIVAAAGRGALVVLPAIAILWTATALSRQTGSKSVTGESSVASDGTETFAFRDHRLYTGRFLTGLLEGDGAELESTRAAATLPWLPTAVFLLAAAMSFCTGTSYGTMGLLTPLTVPLTYSLLAVGGETVSPADPLLLATIGSVLAGAVFGDHCSPISDTTILSAQSCQCDLMAHTLTQLPYAVLVGLVSIVCGTIPIGFGMPVLLTLGLQAMAIIAFTFLLGRRAEDSTPDSESREFST